MLEHLNGLNSTAWVGLTGLILGILGAILAVFKGAQKSPVQVGMPLPPTDQAPYILKELRQLRDDTDEKFDDVLERLSEQDRLLGRIYTDTQVMRDRSHNR